MYVSLNEILSKNKLAVVEVTHKLIYMLKRLNFVDVGQTSLLYYNMPPHVWATNKAQHVHTIFNQTRMVVNQDWAIHSDTMLKLHKHREREPLERERGGKN